MAIRQYIGSRYVPIFDGDWDNTKEYEPLTIVNYSGDSYTSKTIVPAGADIHNTTYWACTGNYNAQVETYRLIVVALKNAVGDNDDLNTTDKSTIVNAINEVLSDIGDLTTLDTTAKNDLVSAVNELYDMIQNVTVNRRYVVISDSYGLVRGGNTPFTTILQTLLGISNDDYFTYSEGSMGFNATGDGGHVAKTLLEAHSGDITDHDTITDIIFAMGANDAYHPTNLATSISTCVSYTKSEYPNAKIHIGYIGNFYPKNGTLVEGYFDSLSDYVQSAASLKCSYIKDVEYIMHDARLMQADLVHPTTAGCNAIASFIYQYLIYGSGGGYKVYKSSSVTSSYCTGSVECTIDNGTANIKINLAFTADFTVGGTLTELCTINDPILEFNPGYLVNQVSFVYNSVSSDYVPVFVYVYSGKVYLQKTAYSAQVTALNGTNLFTTQITLPTTAC